MFVWKTVFVLAAVGEFLSVPWKGEAQPVVNPTMIVDFINEVRAAVTGASNIRKMEWSTELADLAQSHADGCSLSENPSRATKSFHLSGESIDVSSGVTNPDTYILDVLEKWRDEGKFYDYNQNICMDVGCGLYTQLIWATTFRVGCGVNVCSSNGGEKIHFFVCNFHPEGNFYGARPYLIGESCGTCAGPDMMTGSDSHFSVRLPSGQLLCFTVQGEVGAIFNLISTDTLEMNAHFIRLAKNPKNTWLGAIGITVTGKSLVFNATSGKVKVDNHSELDLRSVQKIRVIDQRLALTMTKEVMPKLQPEQIEVIIDKFNIKLSVIFVENKRLDMIWTSGDMDTKNIHGLLGQFLRPGVLIDEENGLLINPGGPSVSVVQQELFSFIHSVSHQYKEQTCWTAVTTSNHGIGSGMIQGSYSDYEVDHILSTGFGSWTGNSSVH